MIRRCFSKTTAILRRNICTRSCCYTSSTRRSVSCLQNCNNYDDGHHHCSNNNNNRHRRSLTHNTCNGALQQHQPHHHKRRHFSSDTAEETAPFNTSMKLKQRTRAAESCRQYNNHYIQHHRHQQAQQGASSPSTQQDDTIQKPILPYDYFHAEVANRLVDRLDDINMGDTTIRQHGFPLALELGNGCDTFIHDAIVAVGGAGCDDYDDLMLMDESGGNEEGGDEKDVEYVGGRGGVRKLVQMDPCLAMLHRDDAFAQKSQQQRINENKDDDDDGSTSSKKTICETYKLQVDIDSNPKTPLPFPNATFDLVISSMTFHWINDLPYLLSEIERILKPDGCLLFAMPGGNTLPELRSSLVLAELERTGGVSTHVGPYIDLSNVGSLLTGTKFKLPTIDIDDIHIGYPNAMVLMEHLGRMGEGNACNNRRDRVGLGTFVSAACLYRELYPEESDGGDGENDGIVASAQVIYGIAWKEHESQQRPDERGSGTQKVGDIAVTQTTTTSG